MSTFLSKEAIRVIRKTIDDNRSVGGTAWKEYSHDELKEIYGYLPSWAV